MSWFEKKEEIKIGVISAEEYEKTLKRKKELESEIREYIIEISKDMYFTTEWILKQLNMFYGEYVEMIKRDIDDARLEIIMGYTHVNIMICEKYYEKEYAYQLCSTSLKDFYRYKKVEKKEEPRVFNIYEFTIFFKNGKRKEIKVKKLSRTLYCVLSPENAIDGASWIEDIHGTTHRIDMSEIETYFHELVEEDWVINNERD